MKPVRSTATIMPSPKARNDEMFARIKTAFDQGLPLVVVYYAADGTHVVSNVDPHQQLVILDNVVHNIKGMH